MTTSFDDIIFTLSTDCFCAELMQGTPSKDVGEVMKTSREAIPKIIQGGENYYMCANFSPKRMKATQNQYLSEIRQKVSKQAADKILTLYETTESLSDDFVTASFTISSIASRLYWLVDEQFATPMSAELLEVIIEIEPLGLDSELHGFDWKRSWLETDSEWDLYIQSIMDGIKEVPYLTFLSINNMHSRLN
jgi:hypothetical protein